GHEAASGERMSLRLDVQWAKTVKGGVCRLEKALAINAAARAVVASAPLVEELVADEASVLTFSGHPDRALAVLGRTAGGDQRTRVVRAIAGAIALAAAGQTGQAGALSRAGHAHPVALGDGPAPAPPAPHARSPRFAPTC